MPIIFLCPRCNTKFRAKDTSAGKTTKCTKCGQAMTIPPAPTEVSPSGEPVLRHQPRERKFELAGGDTSAIESISDHITRYIGKPSGVFHEFVSDLVHLDIHIVDPSPTYNWYTLVTSGMSDRPMTVPEGEEDGRFAELVLHLPAYWQLSNEAFEDDANYWPIYWLKSMARLPHEYETWFAPGHTIPNGDPPEPFGENTQMCCWMLLSPPFFPDEFASLQVESRKTINFLAMLPLYEEEVDFKLQHGAAGLVDRLGQLSIESLIDVRRDNVCKKRFGPF